MGEGGGGDSVELREWRAGFSKLSSCGGEDAELGRRTEAPPAEIGDSFSGLAMRKGPLG